MMDRTFVGLLFALSPCITVSTSNHVVQIVHRASTPAICRKLCLASSGSFNFIRGDHSCRRLSTNESEVRFPDSKTLTPIEDKKTSDSSVSSATPTQKISGNITKGDVAAEDIYESGTQVRPPGKHVKCNANVKLHHACAVGSVDEVQAILSQGLEDINCLDHMDRTPVMTAAKNGQTAVFDFLASEGCDLFSLDRENRTLLHAACEGGVDIVGKLLEKEMFDPEQKGRNGRTALMLAVYYGRRRVVELLEGLGCDQTVLDKYNNNILHVACFGGHVDMVKYILSKYFVDIKSKGAFGWTPLMIAAHGGYRELFDFLVSRGAKLRVLDDTNNNILHVACTGGHVSMVKYILALGIYDMESRGSHGWTPALKAARNGYERVFDLLVKSGCNLKVVDDYGYNLLHVACIYGKVDVVNYILSKGLVGLESRGGKWGRTPLMIAVGRGQRKVASLLINMGSDRMAEDNKGNTVSHLACLGGHLPTVKYLKALGVLRRNVLNHQGQTPVQVAVLRGRASVVAFLKNGI